MTTTHKISITLISIFGGFYLTKLIFKILPDVPEFFFRMAGVIILAMGQDELYDEDFMAVAATTIILILCCATLATILLIAAKLLTSKY